MHLAGINLTPYVPAQCCGDDGRWCTSARNGGEGDCALVLLELHHHGSEIPRDAPDVGQTWCPKGDVGVGREHKAVVAGAEVARDVIVVLSRAFKWFMDGASSVDDGVGERS